MSDRLAVLMYNHLARHELMDATQRKSATPDYRLIEVRNSVLTRVDVPRDVKLTLRGYELIVENPSPVYIRFGIGNYWIGAHLFAVRSMEQIIDLICNTVSEVLPVAMEIDPGKVKDLEKEYVKCVRLHDINSVAGRIITENQNKYGNQYQH